MSKSGVKYVILSKGRYYVMKQHNGKQKYYGIFDNLDDAVKHRNYCIKHNWNDDCVYRRYPDGHSKRYLRETNNGRWVVNKNINGKCVYFGLFDNLEDAMNHRDYCIANDWDLDKCKVKRINKHSLPTHITKGRSGYLLQKKFYDGRDSYHQWFKNLNDAIHEKELLCKCNWSIEELIALDEAEGTL